MSEGSFLMLLINALHNTPIPLQYNAYSDVKLTLEQKIKNAELCFQMLVDSDVEISPEYLNAEGTKRFKIHLKLNNNFRFNFF